MHYGLPYLATLNICSLHSDYWNTIILIRVNEIICIKAFNKDLCIKFYITKMAINIHVFARSAETFGMSQYVTQLKYSIKKSIGVCHNELTCTEYNFHEFSSAFNRTLFSSEGVNKSVITVFIVLNGGTEKGRESVSINAFRDIVILTYRTILLPLLFSVII